MDKELLKQLKNKLTRGDSVAIAREAHVSPSTVIFWLEGRNQPRPQNEEKLLNAVQKVLSAKADRLKRGNETIKTLLSQL